MASLLTTSARVKLRLGIPTAVTQHDAAIGDWVDRVDAWLAGQLQLPGLTAAAYTDTLDVDREGVSMVRLERRPVRAVSSVTDDGTVRPATEYRVHGDEGYVSLTDDDDFFTEGRSKVVVSYTAGFGSTDSIWPSLENAATDWCAASFNRGPMLGLRRVTVARRQTEVSDGLPESVREVLARFNRVM